VPAFVNDQLVSALEDEDDSLQKARRGVEAEPQLTLGRAVVIEWLDPQRPLGGLNRVLG
jgi:hypothetical protein